MEILKKKKKPAMKKKMTEGTCIRKLLIYISSLFTGNREKGEGQRQIAGTRDQRIQTSE